MGKKRDKIKRKKQVKLQERSDRRTAQFVARRLEEIRGELADLIPDFQTFEHYSEIALLTLCLRLLKEMQKKYDRFADGRTWVGEE